MPRSNGSVGLRAAAAALLLLPLLAGAADAPRKTPAKASLVPVALSTAAQNHGGALAPQRANPVADLPAAARPAPAVDLIEGGPSPVESCGCTGV